MKMKRIFLTTLICISMSLVYGQSDFIVKIEKKLTSVGTYIRTSIKNNSNNDIWITNIARTDDCGNAIQTSPSYIIIHAYDANGTLIEESEKLYLTRTMDFPYIAIHLKPQEEYTMYNLLIEETYSCLRAFWRKNKNLNCKKIQYKLHVKYFTDKSETLYEGDFLSNFIDL